MRKAIVPTVILLLLAGTLTAGDTKDCPMKEFVLAGTSNMLGAVANIDKLPEDLRQPLKDVLVYQAGKWTPLEGGKNLVWQRGEFYGCIHCVNNLQGGYGAIRAWLLAGHRDDVRR